MATEFVTKTLSAIVMPKGDAVFSDKATTVTILDEGAGPFLEVSQENEREGAKIRIAPEEWTELREAINTMFEEALK